MSSQISLHVNEKRRFQPLTYPVPVALVFIARGAVYNGGGGGGGRYRRRLTLAFFLPVQVLVLGELEAAVATSNEKQVVSQNTPTGSRY